MFTQTHMCAYHMGKCAAALDALCVGDYFTTAARKKQQVRI